MILDTARDVIAALGGLRSVAELTGRSYVTASSWQSRIGKFPARTHSLLIAELFRRGHTAPASLWGMLEAAE